MKAYEWLDQHEWIQRKFTSTDSHNEIIGACLSGVLAQVYTNEEIDNVYAIVMDICYKKYKVMSITLTNDYCIKTKEEALAILKEAGV